MKTLIKILSIALVAIITTGCAVKDTDSLAMKTAKHTANSPFYVVAGVGMAATLALQGTLIGTAKLLGAKSSKEKEAELALEKQEADAATDTTIDTTIDNQEIDTVATINPSEGI